MSDLAPGSCFAPASLSYAPVGQQWIDRQQQNRIQFSVFQVKNTSISAHNGIRTWNKDTSLRQNLNKIFVMTLLPLLSSAMVMENKALVWSGSFRSRLCREVLGTPGGQKSEGQSQQQFQGEWHQYKKLKVDFDFIMANLAGWHFDSTKLLSKWK